MIAAILSDNIRSALKIYKETRQVGGCLCDICLCNGTGRSLFSYVARQCVSLLLGEKRMIAPALRLFLRGRLRFFFKGLHSHEVQEKLRGKNYDIGLHDAAVIYNNSVIQCFKKGILNAHIGLLPRYRGRSVMEWSLYEGAATGVTVFYIDEGIDTGKNIVIREEVPVNDCKNIAGAKAKLFALAGRFYAKALRAELAGAEYLQNEGESPRFYVMSKKLLAKVERDHFGKGQIS